MKRFTIKDNYYHSYSRGIEKQDIFLNHKDYLRFMSLINICNRKNSKRLSLLLKKYSLEELSVYTPSEDNLVEIELYTLMPNHFHIESKEKRDGNLSKFKQRLLNSYAKYFNKKYKRKGYLFEDRYKFKIIKTDIYLYIVRDYIRKNPLKLIDKNYKHTDLLTENRKLTKKESFFLKNYPYKYDSHPM